MRISRYLPEALPESQLFRVALDALEHRDVAKIDRMLEGFVCLVAGFAFSTREPAKIDRVLKGDGLWSCCRPR